MIKIFKIYKPIPEQTEEIIKQACINEEISKDSFRSLIIYFIPESKHK